MELFILHCMTLAKAKTASAGGFQHSPAYFIHEQYHPGLKQIGISKSQVTMATCWFAAIEWTRSNGNSQTQWSKALPKR